MRRLRLFVLVTAVAVAALVMSGCDTNPLVSREGVAAGLSGSGASPSAASQLDTTDDLFGDTPGGQLSCFAGEACLPPAEEGSYNPAAVALAIEALVHLIKNAGGNDQCAWGDPRERLKCLQNEAQNNGVVSPTTPPSTPVPGNESVYQLKSILSPNTSTMPGSPVDAQTGLLVYNVGNMPVAITAELRVVQPGQCQTLTPGPAVEGIEVSPDSIEPTPLAAGMVLAKPLSISVEDSVPVGRYQICAVVLESGTMVSSLATAMLTVTNVPLRVDQSHMPDDVIPSSPDIDGTITITNLSPATYSTISVTQQFQPGSDVTLTKASLEDGTCDVDAANSKVTCALPSIDKYDSKDLDLTFDSHASWTGPLLSAVSLTVVGNPGSGSLKTIGSTMSPSAGTYPVGPWIAQSRDTHLNGPSLMTYQDRDLYLAEGGTLQLRDTSSGLAVWAPDPTANGGRSVWAQMQVDGNFVVYGEPYPPYTPTPQWATATSAGSDTVVAALGTAYTPDGVTAIDTGVQFYIFDVTNGTVLFDSAGTPVPFAAVLK